MIQLKDQKDMQITWFALLVEQQKYKSGTKTWFRIEDLIRKFEHELGMKERSRLTIVKN